MPKLTLTEMRQELGEIVEQQRKVLDKAQTEKRALSADENTEYENRDKRVDELETMIRREERLQEREAALARENREEARPVIENTSKETRGNFRATEEYRGAFNSYLLGNRSAQVMNTLEHRDLQSNTDSLGGYMVAPVQFVDALLKFADDLVFIRQMATKFTLANAQSMGAPSLDTDPADADWTSEVLIGGTDSSMAFGKRELTPHPLAKLIKVSSKLLRQNPAVDTLVQQRLNYKFAISEEKSFLTGSGSNQPLGLFTASAQGISTGRDVQTGSSTSITADGVIDALYSLKAPYQAKASWLFHRDAVKIVRKLKDQQNQYLWQPGLAGGQPSTILDRPFSMSEYVPNTFTTGLYVGMVGDFSFYWICDALDMTVQRLLELYAASNQVGFIGRKETDGMPALEEAFARMKTN